MAPAPLRVTAPRDLLNKMDGHVVFEHHVVTERLPVRKKAHRGSLRPLDPLRGHHAGFCVHNIMCFVMLSAGGDQELVIRREKMAVLFEQRHSEG
eukprot:1056667-Pyramimonas_sp.AAC.1